ncbi:MAG: hypothetical protein HWE08_14565 [Alphaproteobacteria bacterium]|nr:hypothetical protein [Alphaproteobacteria bacterium]
MDDLIKRKALKSAKALSATEDPTSQVYAEYMANIIKQMPNPGALTLLTGTANAQASFYFKSPTTSEINDNLYNNILSPRAAGMGQQYGINQAKLEASTFINAYNQLYLSLRYQLSQADQAIEQKLVAAVAGTITSLRPTWNAWVQAYGSSATPPIPALNMNDTNVALMQLTGTLQTQWVNPQYTEKLQNDPSYPYVHMNDFDTIFNQIPPTVPALMRDQIKQVYNAQGAEGGLTAQVANATQTLNGIRNNIQHPTAANGGLKLTGSSKMIPGMTFQPADPITLVNELAANPPTQVFKYSSTVTRSEDETLSVSVSGSGGINIPILDFFSIGTGGGFSSSIFQEEFAGSKYSVDVTVNNATLQPMFTVEPQLYNISTAQGWLSSDPVKQALANGGNTDVTGYVFDGGVPSFNFGEGGDLGFINAIVFSQFLELSITFDQCNSKQVKEYFEQHASATLRFLGIPLGGVSESSSYSYNYSAETDTSITVTMKPNAPGYVPGGTDITQSLCNLVAVGVKYPFA